MPSDFPNQPADYPLGTTDVEIESDATERPEEDELDYEKADEDAGR